MSPEEDLKHRTLGAIAFIAYWLMVMAPLGYGIGQMFNGSPILGVAMIAFSAILYMVAGNPVPRTLKPFQKALIDYSNL